MAIQYSDTHFSDNMSFGEAKRKFEECLENGVPVQALHVGTEEELNKRKEKACLQKQFDELQGRLCELEGTVKTQKSDVLIAPTMEEIREITKA